jgi:putative endonuclease
MAVYCVYVLTNWNRTTLYTGVTSNVAVRVQQHRDGNGSAFTRRYRVTNLVYFEEFVDVTEAIAREKQIKGGSRRKKEDIINRFNPGWLDLFDDVKA